MELDHEFTVPVPVGQAWPVLLDIERVAPCMPGATLDSLDGDEFTGRLKVRLGAMTITYKGTARITAKDEAAHSVTIDGSGKEARGSGTASATVQAQLHADGDQTRVTVHTKLNVTGKPAQFGRNILSEVGGKLITRFAKALSEELARTEDPAPEPTHAPNTTAPTAEPGVTPTAERTGEPTELRAAEPSAERTGELTEPPAADPTGEPVEPGVTPAAERTGEPTEPRAAESGAAEASRTSVVHSSAASATRSARPTEDAIDLMEFAGPAIAKRAIPIAGVLLVLLVIWRIIRRR